MTFHSVKEGQEDAGELVGASRCVWALPAPNSSARTGPCQGIMRAVPERGHSQPCWQCQLRTEAEPQLLQLLHCSPRGSAGSSWQHLCTARSPELVLNWEREPCAELQGREEPLEGRTPNNCCFGQSITEPGPQPRHSQERSSSRRWLQGHCPSALAASLLAPGHSRGTAAPGACCQRGITCDPGITCQPGIACGMAAVPKGLEKCHSSPCRHSRCHLHALSMGPPHLHHSHPRSLCSARARGASQGC